MGGKQSQPVNGGSECKPCFFFSPVARPPSDLIGSPIPDTPMFERKRRQNIQEAVIRDCDDPLYSSRYEGLEKEESTMSFSGGRSSGTCLVEEEATVHEGVDCEQQLHAKYELLEVLGVGSTSTVHRCVRKATGEEFACKVIDCQLIDEKFQGMMTQFQTEIESLRLLKHPGIIRLYDVYIKANDKIYIVMELMDGGELFDYVVLKGALTEGEASQIVRKVAEALSYLHSKNIVHRDLKPENLLLKHKPKGNNDPIDVKIIDFGLSKAMEEPIARTFLGTRGYLAPEMLQRREYTRAVDAWALGVIVFVLLCGCLPFDDDSASVPSDDLVKVRFVLRFPRWAKNLSLSAKDLLNHLLDVNPRTRYTAEQALDHPWVRGETAPKGNLLASPGRIKKSPALVGSARNGRYTKAGRKYAPDAILTPPTPQGPRVRKGSI
jgi:serine/threonine protein kinase